MKRESIDPLTVEVIMNGVPFGANLDERVEAARRLYEKGKTQAEIARRLEVSPTTVRTWRNGGWRGFTEPPPRDKTPDECGRPFMYRRHLERGEKPCDECRAASAAVRRETRRRAKDRKARKDNAKL